jgi:hypothetical protein
LFASPVQENDKWGNSVTRVPKPYQQDDDSINNEEEKIKIKDRKCYNVPVCAPWQELEFLLGVI